jgi:hypothetical protein
METALTHMEEALMLKKMATDKRHPELRHDNAESFLMVFSLLTLFLYVVLRW